MMFDINPEHLQMLQNILRANVPGHQAWVFGSRAKFAAKKYSDLDICIKGEDALSFSTLAHLKDDLSESNIPYKVDIIDWYNVSESFKKIIDRDKIELIF